MPSNHRDFLIDRKGSKIVGIIYFGWNIISILTFFKSFDVKKSSKVGNTVIQLSFLTCWPMVIIFEFSHREGV